MTTVAKLREQTRIARESGTYVVITADEAKAVVDELDALIHDNARAIAMNAELATDAAARESAAASAMRERCAQACEAIYGPWDANNSPEQSVAVVRDACAAAVRALEV